MASEQEPVHLSSNHRDTLEKLLQHPVNHNVDWHSARLLLEEAGTVAERHDGKFAVTLGSETVVLERPRGKDLTEQQVVDLRRMLIAAGYTT